MRKTLLFQLLLLSCFLIGGSLFAQQMAPTSLNLPAPTGLTTATMRHSVGNSGLPGTETTVPCSQDTVLYTIQKATGLRAININNSTSASGASQYFDAPQAITVSGFRFYAYSISTPTLNVTASLYLAAPDSTPLGSPLRTVTVGIDSNTVQGLADYEEFAVFTTPITMTQPYVLVVQNLSATPMGLVCSDYTMGDGAGENLSSAQLGANWVRGYGLNVGGSPFNCDWLLDPMVTYNLGTSFTLNPGCLSGPNTTVTFTSTSSSVLSNRMYNLAVFLDLERLSTTWNFGDGSPEVNAIDTFHVYTAVGTYMVTKTDTLFGWSTICVNDTMATLGTAATSAFSSAPSGLSVAFTNTSVGGTTSLWDFGDGNTSTSANPSHTYTSPGTYLVCLTVSGTCGSDSSCQNITVTCAAPTSAYTASSNLLTANFTDGSTGSGSLTYFWDFGDGNTSTAQNPSHTYAAGGTYQVCLTVSDICGTDSSCQNVVISCPAPSPAFTASANLLNATFTDGSSGNGNLSYFWDFGDGNTATTQNPSHTYGAAGTYLVCLTITDDCGSDSTCQNLSVVSVGMEESLSSRISLFPNPAQNQVKIALDLPNLENVEVRMFNPLGELVREFDLTNVQSTEIPLNLNGLSNGAYMVNFRIGELQVMKRLNILR